MGKYSEKLGKKGYTIRQVPNFSMSANDCVFCRTFAKTISFPMKRHSNKWLIVASLFLLVLCSSWGFLVHRTVNQLAVYQLPKKLQPFFYQNLDYIVKYSIRPDERRSSDKTEATKHFIDLEAYGDSTVRTMPLKWDDAAQRYSKDTLLKYGYVPYWVVEMKNKLTNAFRLHNKDSILFYATDLGHYIGDANVPLHTTINYDGQLTGQKGLHALWESVVPELTIEQFNLAGKKKAKYLKHPEKAIWEAVHHANSLLPEVFGAEKEVSKDFTEATKYRIQQRNGREVKYYTRDFALAYAQRLQPSINGQLLRAANLMADFWYTAWVDAGKPGLQDLLPQALTAEEKNKMKNDGKAYRNNELLKNGLLISKRDAVVDPSNN